MLLGERPGQDRKEPQGVRWSSVNIQAPGHRLWGDVPAAQAFVFSSLSF